MAFRRKSYKRRYKRPAFTKRQAKAIQAIAAKPVETKHFPYYAPLVTYLNDSGYVSGPNFIFFRNIYSPIPREDNTLTKSETTFIGNEIQSRGFRWECHFYTVATQPGSALDIQFRYTLFSASQYFNGTAGIGPADPNFFDIDHDTTPTWSKWNTQNVHIYQQRIFRLDNNGNLNAMTRRKYYQPLRRKVTSVLDASLVTNSFMREVKNKQVYWALECFAPGFLTGADLKTYINGSIDTNVYFKDA